MLLTNVPEADAVFGSISAILVDLENLRSGLEDTKKGIL